MFLVTYTIDWLCYRLAKPIACLGMIYVMDPTTLKNNNSTWALFHPPKSGRKQKGWGIVQIMQSTQYPNGLIQPIGWDLPLFPQLFNWILPIISQIWDLVTKSAMKLIQLRDYELMSVWRSLFEKSGRSFW